MVKINDASTALAVPRPDPASTMLAKLEIADKKLAKAYTLQEVVKIVEEAQQVTIIARGVKVALEYQNRAAELYLKAQIKAGESLARLEKGKGGRPTKTDQIVSAGQTAATTAGVSEYRRALEDAGVSERTAQRWQELAREKEAVEKYIEKTKAEGEEITTSGARSAVQDHSSIRPSSPTMPSGASSMTRAKGSPSRRSGLHSSSRRGRKGKHARSAREMLHDFLRTSFPGDTTIKRAMEETRKKFHHQRLPGDLNLESLLADFLLDRLGDVVPNVLDALCAIETDKGRLGDLRLRDLALLRQSNGEKES